MVSAVLKRTGHYGSVQWDGHDPGVVKFKYIPRHVNPMVGDSVVTSGFNAIFPEGVMIGTIIDKKLDNEALSYDLSVRLSQDFRKLSYVTIVRSELKQEVDSLEQVVNAMER
jgi:rod shape-determining protein MreC